MAWSADQAGTGLLQSASGQPGTSLGGYGIQALAGNGMGGQILTGVYDTVPGMAAAANALRPGLGRVGVVTPLKAGVEFEAQQLAALGRTKNDMVWHPSLEQTQSAAFKVIVGEAKYTPGGLLRGTTLDAIDAGLLEIKGGGSPLDSSYQLRLQTYRSLIEAQPYTLRTQGRSTRLSRPGSKGGA